ncbi:MAG TPA: NAD-dependent epimerase/dehydratase family protein [Tepidisphaeraceae bacterium]|jgi:nucleoside-diphosphate-sugar epimerase
MKVLIIGGTGLISTGVIKHLLARHADVTMLNRAQRENRVGDQVCQITADRHDIAALELAARQNFDVVIDMICFSPEEAEDDVRVFAGRCRHFIFCSTVCTYGVNIPPRVLVDETFPQDPISDYGKNKLRCEQLFLRAHADGRFNATIIRPSSTYGRGGRLIDNLEFDPIAWDRIERNLPVVCAGDGLGLWVSTHRDDVGKLFAYAAHNEKTFGQSYNATRDRIFTWRDLYRESALSLGCAPKLLFMPAQWIVNHDPKRFALLKEITQFHGAYSSEKAKRDVPEFRCEIDYPTGARETIQDIKQRGAWRESRGDELYDEMVNKALSLGIEPITL